MSDTPKDPAQDGKGTAASATPQVKVATHAVEPPRVASPWARLKEHKVAQWTLAYAAFAFALLRGATVMSDVTQRQFVLAILVVAK